MVEIDLAYCHIGDIRALFAEYAASLGLDLGYQGFDEELRDLPGRYGPPSGRLYLARYGGHAAGCAALRPMDGTHGEVKRLFVRPEYRNRHIGELLMRRLLSDAREAGYTRLYLDTLPTMHTAISLYEKLGFWETTAYYDTPVGESKFFVIHLDKERGGY